MWISQHRHWERYAAGSPSSSYGSGGRLRWDRAILRSGVKAIDGLDGAGNGAVMDAIVPVPRSVRWSDMVGCCSRRCYGGSVKTDETEDQRSPQDRCDQTDAPPTVLPPFPNNCQLRSNSNPFIPSQRALLVALLQWITHGKEPPRSLYPTIGGGSLVPVQQITIPYIPAVNFNENRLGRHYSRFSGFRLMPLVTEQSLALRKS